MPVYTKLFLVFFLLVYFSYYAVIHIFRKNEHLAYKLSNILLLISSMAFYAYSGVRFLIVLLLFGAVAYISGIVLSRVSTKFRKLFTFLFIFIEILPICLYRIIGLYLNIAGKNGPVSVLGLSFFSLQIVTYTYGVYANRIDAEKSILSVMLFACFFPCVSSGPIQRAEKLLPQIRKRRVFDYDSSADGLKLLAFGYFKKLVLADNLAVYIQSVRNDYAQAYALAVLLSVILYSFQLYLDFSGYSDIVTGCAKTFGFDLGKNFDHPYLSRSVSEFWGRWHISLSSWLRDFVY
ncbi:MBOAT family O-acyltransferase [Butyrivibrio sp. YAB3001]|uniref:MBOAT family O-acyltransferase n=1 Tax=Butyrivibrio sp. YAB3001 TaxID=1520812 RepID=UPI0008F66972|nr:MBOAT family O-acyltransferase [Butyrivibrio sp. YAB3001]SFB70854.1 MBOAT, membrane-bound O-acyltransferase family [Butyrivibrio sp. YAB3001]